MHSLAAVLAALLFSTIVIPIWTNVLPEDWEEYIPEGAPGTSQPFRDDLFEGDIVLRTPANAVANAVNWDGRWKNNEVHYEISGDFDSEQRGTIESAMRGISSKTCIKFHRRTNQPDYLYIFSGSGCWTTLGRKGGRQELSLMKPNGHGTCVTYGIAAHELLHALGFHHEQSRSDRDDYVTIIESNIKPGMHGQFTKENTDNMDFAYDYKSVMHYATDDMSKNGQPTILPKSKRVWIGQREGPSIIDIQKVNKYYRCSDTGSPEPSGQNINWNGKNWAHGCYFASNDIVWIKSKPEFCGPKCEENSECTHYDFLNEHCVLKRGSASKNQARAINDQNRICGVKEKKTAASINWNGQKWAHGCFFAGNDITWIESRPEFCGPRCDGNSECTHYDFLNGHCVLKRGPASKGNAQPVDDQSRICGVR